MTNGKRGAASHSYLTGRHLILPLTLATSLFFLWGFSYGLLNVLNKHFQNVLKITRLQSTALQIVYFGGGYFCFSPIAAEILKRKGYKVTIVLGLALFALGSIGCWPAVHFFDPAHGQRTFTAFVVCTLVFACGLATLETSANSYVTIIGSPKTAVMRLQFCQAWNGVAAFIGPMLASELFFSEKNSRNFHGAQYVYIAVACVATLVALLFACSTVPKGDHDDRQAAAKRTKRTSPLWKQYNLILAFLATFCYAGAQVATDSFFINYATENAEFTDAEASHLLSYALIIFTIGRLVGILLAHFLQSDFILVVFSVIGTMLSVYVAMHRGATAVLVLVIFYFFQSIVFPTIFVLGTADLGRHTHRGAGILIMGVSGAAVFPPIQGAIADRYRIRTSYLVPVVGCVVVCAYAVFYWITHGFRVRRSARAMQPNADNTESSAFIAPSLATTLPP